MIWIVNPDISEVLGGDLSGLIIKNENFSVWG
jgi:hypothetical protein